jgi:hypothetical protein
MESKTDPEARGHPGDCGCAVGKPYLIVVSNSVEGLEGGVGQRPRSLIRYIFTVNSIESYPTCPEYCDPIAQPMHKHI